MGSEESVGTTIIRRTRIGRTKRMNTQAFAKNNCRRTVPIVKIQIRLAHTGADAELANARATLRRAGRHTPQPSVEFYLEGDNTSFVMKD